LLQPVGKTVQELRDEPVPDEVDVFLEEPVVQHVNFVHQDSHPHSDTEKYQEKQPSV